MMERGLARLRVPLGFVAAAIAFVFVRPTGASWLLGAPLALAGEALRVWAAGHIEKGREITRSGPYRFVRHPLYLGSSLIGLGFVVAANSALVAAVVTLYLGLTLVSAMRLEEAHLDEKFSGAYSAYRAGQAAAPRRPFSWARVAGNREHPAMFGLVMAFAYLLLRLER
jgi:protein-S-isoprenylcysteine O-methyltransferase Ste14